MALTKSFKDTIQARALRDPEFREGLLKESIECLLSGDTATGKTMLRDYINATIGFESLAGLTGKSSKSLMRMFGPGGNPRANNLFCIIGLLQKKEGIRLEVHTTR
ncbi:MAG: transcriptional regulator [Candidatus Scalindua sp.]